MPPDTEASNKVPCSNIFECSLAIEELILRACADIDSGQFDVVVNRIIARAIDSYGGSFQPGQIVSLARFCSILKNEFEKQGVYSIPSFRARTSLNLRLAAISRPCVGPIHLCSELTCPLPMSVTWSNTTNTRRDGCATISMRKIRELRRDDVFPLLDEAYKGSMANRLLYLLRGMSQEEGEPVSPSSAPVLGLLLERRAIEVEPRPNRGPDGAQLPVPRHQPPMKRALDLPPEQYKAHKAPKVKRESDEKLRDGASTDKPESDLTLQSMSGQNKDLTQRIQDLKDELKNKYDTLIRKSASIEKLIGQLGEVSHLRKANEELQSKVSGLRSENGNLTVRNKALKADAERSRKLLKSFEDGNRKVS